MYWFYFLHRVSVLVGDRCWTALLNKMCGFLKMWPWLETNCDQWGHPAILFVSGRHMPCKVCELGFS